MTTRIVRRRLALHTLPALALALACGQGSGDGKATKADAKGKVEAKAKPADDGGKAIADPDGGDMADDGGAAPAAAWSWTLPRGINVPPVVPEDNPMSAAKVELGHQLFMDKRLSVDGTRSCYSCHQNELGNADGRVKALGPGGKNLPRNTPTIWNVGLHAALYWDGRSATLEAQGLAALKGGNMGLGDGLEAKATEIGALAEYKDAFAKAFELEAGKVTADHVAKALSAYQRTLLCGDTKHDQAALDPAAERGWQLFIGKAACVTCHVQDNLSDGLFHRTGIGMVDPASEGADLGRGKISGNAAENFAFRTPTLRNVGRTAPYFHDGSAATLEEAVKIMSGGGKRDAGPVDEKLLDRQLSEAEQADVVAFLRSLDCPGQLEVIGDQKVDGIGDAGAPAGDEPDDAKQDDAKADDKADAKDDTKTDAAKSDGKAG
jgi:cytochrome c peroxidase